MENLVVGVARFVLHLRGCRSLKEKRGVVRPIRDRLTAHHNVSVGEVGAQDDHERAILALAMVGTDAKGLRSTLDQLLERVDAMGLAPIVERHVEVVNYGDEFAAQAFDFPERF